LQHSKKTKELENIFNGHKELFSTFAHDIRNFANSINGILNILEINENDTNKLKYINIAKQAVNMIINLVSDVVDLSKIGEGKLDINEYFYIPSIEYENIFKIFSHMQFPKKFKCTVLSTQKFHLQSKEMNIE